MTSERALERPSQAQGEACGKVILLGEHTVVHGSPALAAAIERGARASAAELTGKVNTNSSLRVGERAVFADAASDDDLARAFTALLAAGEPVPPVDVTAASDLPSGGGLGSSAALAVAIARAVERLAGRDESGVLARADAWERVFHGNPSGIDTAAASTGGCLRFSRADGIRLIELPSPLWLCVGWSGESSSTRAMVEGVARLRSRKPEMVERSIEGATSLVENAIHALRAGDAAAVGKLMDLGQMILAGLLLSTEAIERLCSLARSAGALGAKLTGAGGGGSVIALVPPADDDPLSPPPAADAILSAWRSAGFSGFLTRAGALSPRPPEE